MNKSYTTLFVGISLASLAGVAQASSVTFANFFQDLGSFSGPGATYTLDPITDNGTLVSVNIPVIFDYQDLLGTTGTGAAIGTDYQATFNLTAHLSLGDNLQSFSDSAIDDVTFSFIDPTWVADGLAGPNLLSGTAGDGFTGLAGDLFAPDQALTGGVQGSNLPNTSFVAPDFVNFTSDNVNTGKLTEQNYAFTLGSLAPFSYTSVGFVDYLNSFQASITGTFAASYTPEPGSVTLGLSTLVAFSVINLRRRRRK